MVDTIGPMVRAAPARARRIQWAHVAGGVLGGASTGFFLGAIGSVARLGPHLPRWLTWAFAVAAAAALVYDSSREGNRIGLARQTPRAWRHVLPPGAAAFFNGFDLGLGWSTRIYFSSYLVAMAAALATGHAVVGAAIGASFGGSRSLFVVLAQRRTAETLSIDSIAEHRPRVALLNALALAQFGLLMGFAALAIL